MSATSLFVPVMMVFSFSPMLAMFNDKIEKVARVFYTQQLRVLMNQMSFEGIKTESILILVVNAVLAVVLFFAAFRKKGLE
jgi:ABC-2 type transport system permease protein